MPSSVPTRGDRRNRATLADVLFLATCALAIASVVVVQLAWILSFDSTGLDRIVPDPIMTQFGPAATVALLTGGFALYRRDRMVAAATSAVVFVAALTLASWTIGFYGLCGGC